MTIRNLRQMLTHVGDQEMTIKQLRDILFEVEDQDAELDRTQLEILTGEFGKCYYFTSEDEEHVRRFPANTSKSTFFRLVSKEIAFSDCSDVEVTRIVFNGIAYQYGGWKPGMLFIFTGEDGSTWTGCFPEFDH